MKRIPRNSARFEAIDLFGAIGHHLGFDLKSKTSLREFGATLGEALTEAAENPIVVQGRRTERMFGFVVASLGKASLITQEDAGDVFAQDTSIRIPDYRIHFSDEPNILVEVKNLHSKSITKKFRIRENDVQALKRYAMVARAEFLLAIYWSKFKVWTLVDPESLPLKSNKRRVSFGEAMTLNQMHRVGDMLIATEPPLVVRLSADPTRPRLIDAEGMVNFTIGSTSIFCGGREVKSSEEGRIAFYLILFGPWKEENRVKIDGGNLVHVDFEFRPPEYDASQGFAMVSHISSMISDYYDQLTASEGGDVTALAPLVEPGSLGLLIRKDYRGDALKLWRFTVAPSDSTENKWMHA